MNRIDVEKVFQADANRISYDSVKEFLSENNHFTDYHFLFDRIYSQENGKEKLVKVAVLSSFTIEQIKELLAVETYKYGLRSDVYIAGYNQYELEILGKKSGLYAFSPDVVILAVRIEELFPDFCCRFLKLRKEEIKAQCDVIIDKYQNLVENLKNAFDAQIIIHNFTHPLFLEGSLFDSQNIDGQTEYINILNHRLKELASACPGCYVFDINYYLYEFGAVRAHDDKMWFLARNPFSRDFLIALAVRYGQFIKTIFGRRKKCLVLDADNTLWGGIVGEDGIQGIELGHSYPGNVYRQIQQTIKQYSHQGVILALNSKNNVEDVRKVFDNHPSMVLKWNDFASVRVNWSNKTENMQEIADELNIDIDSLVFVDDNPFEIEMLKQAYPEVQTIQFTDNVLHNLSLLKNLDAFQNIQILDSDLNKTQQYMDNAKRNRLRKTSSSLKDFYRSLQMKVEIRLCSEFDIKRVAQLTQKTNQFNLTTRRYTEADIEKFVHSENYRVYTLRLQDKFGDNGLTGVMIVSDEGNKWYIDTFLMSCRIIGRTVETAFLSFVAQEARNHNISFVIGQYIPTAKNKLVEDLFQKHGFTKKDSNLWILDLSECINFHEWIELI